MDVSKHHQTAVQPYPSNSDMWDNEPVRDKQPEKRNVKISQVSLFSGFVLSFRSKHLNQINRSETIKFKVLPVRGAFWCLKALQPAAASFYTRCQKCLKLSVPPLPVSSEEKVTGPETERIPVLQNSWVIAETKFCRDRNSPRISKTCHSVWDQP